MRSNSLMLLLLACLTILPTNADARTRGGGSSPNPPDLTVPSGSTSGVFVVSWAGISGSDRVYVQESVNGGGFSDIHTSIGPGSLTISRTGDNEFSYRAKVCSTSNGCSGFSSPVTVSVYTRAGISAEPYHEQLGYEYSVRSGDFDGDGHQDVLVDRLTPGSVDGSLQTTLLSGSSSGMAVEIPSGAEAAAARSFPIDESITLGGSDYNFDGFADIVLVGLGSLGSASFPEDSLILYASGKNGTARPLGARFIDEELSGFIYDVAQSIGDSRYYSLNQSVTRRPIFRTFFDCRRASFSDDDGSFPLFNCYWRTVFMGVETQIVGIGYHPQAPDVTDAYDAIRTRDFSQGSPFKRLSDRLLPLLGVPSFGFQADGSRQPTNYAGDDTEADEYDSLLTRFVIWLMRTAYDDPQGGNPLTYDRHVYDTDSYICSTTLDTPVDMVPVTGPLGTSNQENIEKEQRE